MSILFFGYGISFKYEIKLLHQIDRFYVVTRFISPTMEDINIKPIEYHMDWIKLDRTVHAVEHVTNIFHFN